MGLSTRNIGKGNSTKKTKPSEALALQRKKTQELRDHHEHLFKSEGVKKSMVKFIPRTPFTHDDILVVGFQRKYLFGETDIYIEFCTRDLKPDDNARTLYKWEYQKDWDSKYELGKPHPATGKQLVLIPVTELVNVSEYYWMLNNKQGKQLEIGEQVVEEVVKTQEKVVSLPNAEELDAPALTNLTIRDVAAILWRKPVSNKESLNALINNTFTNE